MLEWSLEMNRLALTNNVYKHRFSSIKGWKFKVLSNKSKMTTWHISNAKNISSSFLPASEIQLKLFLETENCFTIKRFITYSSQTAHWFKLLFLFFQ